LFFFQKNVPYIELKQVSPNDLVVLFIMSTIDLWRVIWILRGGIKKYAKGLIDKLVLRVKVRAFIISHLVLSASKLSKVLKTITYWDPALRDRRLT
jgi:hypothetical protein